MEQSNDGDLLLGFPPMEETELLLSVSKSIAMIACTSMAFFYVAILYSPTLILRMPHSTSLNSFMIRRFVCAGVSSVVSVFVCALLLLPMKDWGLLYFWGVYGIRLDHTWNAVVYPLSLTCLLYSGSFLSKLLFILDSLKKDSVRRDSVSCMKSITQRFLEWITAVSSNILAWRNYIVAPFTEELVFRACMIPLLLCGGFSRYSIIFFSPVFFSLAHLNHFLELYCQKNYSFVKAALIVGLQLGYTVIFGSYASFLFIRTGHILAPMVAHIFCNIMGLPVISPQRKGLTIAATLAGFAGFAWFLFPSTSPNLYNDRIDNCRCWHGYCSWT